MKPWKSRTIWINSIIGVCSGLSLFFPQLLSVPAFIQANVAGIAVGWSVLNIVLRAISKNAISLEE